MKLVTRLIKQTQKRLKATDTLKAFRRLLVNRVMLKNALRVSVAINTVNLYSKILP